MMLSNVVSLQAKADVLHRLLEHYARSDSDVEMVLGFMTPIFNDIRAGKVLPPCQDEFGWHFASTESPLYRKYADLSRAAAEYSCALEDWESQDWFKALVKQDKAQ